MSDAAGLIPTTTAKPAPRHPPRPRPQGGQTRDDVEAVAGKPLSPLEPADLDYGPRFRDEAGDDWFRAGRQCGGLPLEEVYEPIKDALRGVLAGSEEFERLTSLRSQEADSSRRKHAANERLVKLIGERAAAVAKAGAGLGKTLVRLDGQSPGPRRIWPRSRRSWMRSCRCGRPRRRRWRALQAQAASAAQQERDILAARRNAAAQEAIEALCQAAGPLTKFAVLDLTIGRYFSSVRELALEAMVSRLADGDVQPPAKPTVAHRSPGRRHYHRHGSSRVAAGRLHLPGVRRADRPSGRGQQAWDFARRDQRAGRHVAPLASIALGLTA